MPKAKVYITKYLTHLLFFLTLTILTQIGGLIYICLTPFFSFIKKKLPNKHLKVLIKLFSFITIYSLVSLLIVPPIAKQFGRVPLPISSSTLKPVTALTYLCNRHYVKPKLRTLLVKNSQEIYESNGITTYYLDANFPFINKFPLLPHLSHNDGKKIDIAFYYTNDENTKQQLGSPSPIGYGIEVSLLANEINKKAECEAKGYWQYNLISKLVAPFGKKGYSFNSKATKQFLLLLTREKETEKIFIEPYLVKLLGIKSSKVRFHGCHAVSHADHIHLQIR